MDATLGYKNPTTFCFKDIFTHFGFTSVKNVEKNQTFMSNFQYNSQLPHIRLEFRKKKKCFAKSRNGSKEFRFSREDNVFEFIHKAMNIK